jgi:hypothetical protein
MKIKIIALTLLTSAVICEAALITITTAFGSGADAWVTENSDVSGGDGTGAALNARYASGSDRNEYIFLRFDLAEITAGSVTTSSLNLTAYRTEANYRLNIYGLNDNASGQNWDEATVQFDGAPGLVFDSDSSTRGLVGADTTLLGGNILENATEGAVLSFSDADLISFLNADTDGLVTFLIERETNVGGQARFASKEATTLDSGGTPVAAGTYASYLQVDATAIPEPGTYALLGGLLALGYVMVRRRV